MGTPALLEHIQLRAQELQLHRLPSEQLLKFTDIGRRPRVGRHYLTTPGRTRDGAPLRRESLPTMQQAPRDSQLSAELREGQLAARNASRA